MNPFLREKKKKDTTKEPIYNTVSSPKAGQNVKLWMLFFVAENKNDTTTWEDSWLEKSS